MKENTCSHFKFCVILNFRLHARATIIVELMNNKKNEYLMLRADVFSVPYENKMADCLRLLLVTDTVCFDYFTLAQPLLAQRFLELPFWVDKMEE